MDYETLLDLTAGSVGNEVHAVIEFSGKLTPSVARDAAKRAFGHTVGVTVWDGRKGYGYRLTSSGCRKVKETF